MPGTPRRGLWQGTGVEPQWNWPTWPLPPDDQRVRQRFRAAGPLALPAVTTLPGLVLDTTDVEFQGSVNPSGLATAAWFAWGTTAQWGNTTTPVSVGSGSIPVVSSFKLTGQPTGEPIHFVAIAQSAAGTVYGQDLVITPQYIQPVVTPFDVPIPTAQPTVAQPHFAFPFAMGTNGASVYEQDTLQEVFGCVYAIASCTIGDCPELPDFGIPDQLFLNAQPNPSEVTNALQVLEPRATELATTYQVGDDGRVLMRFDTQIPQIQGGTAT